MDVYDLTPITGRTAQDRRTTLVLGKVVRQRTKNIAIVAFLMGAVVSAVLQAFLGAVGFVIGGATFAATMGLGTMSSARGLKVRMWRSLYNKTRANNGSPMRVHARVTTDPAQPMRVTTTLTPACLAQAGFAPMPGHTVSPHTRDSSQWVPYPGGHPLAPPPLSATGFLPPSSDAR